MDRDLWEIRASESKNIGSNFEEGLLKEAAAVAVKRVVAWQIAEEMKGQNMTKTSLAEKMRTSKASLNRLLDQNDSSLTLTTLTSPLSGPWQKIKIELVPA
jgi:hypothetical protein